MKHITIFLVFLFYCCSLKSEADKHSDQAWNRFEESKSEQGSTVVAGDAEFIATNHYDKAKRDEAQQWLNNYNAMKANRAKEVASKSRALQQRFENLGGAKEISTQAIGCNEYKSIFALNKTVTDSVQLAFMVDYLADINYVKLRSEKRCNTPVKYTVRLFKNETDYKKTESIYIASCYISPANMDGEVVVSGLKDAR